MNARSPDGVPPVFRSLLARVLSRNVREHVLGDLEERHRRIAAAKGQAAAARWYRAQALALCLQPSLLRTADLRVALPSTQGLRSDLRLAARGMRKEPVTTTAIVMSLAVAVGALTAVFGAFDRFLVRLPDGIAGPERMVEVYQVPTEGVVWTLGYQSHRVLSQGALRGLLGESRTLQEGSLVLPRWNLSVLVDGDRPERLGASFVSANFFDLLGVRPALGRTFSPDPGDSVEERIVVITHALWQRRFGGRPDVLGRTLTVEGVDLTIAGVAPPGFVGTSVSRAPDLWLPLSMIELIPYWGQRAGSSGVNMFIGVARLADGVSLPQAAEELDRIRQELYGERPATFRPVPLTDVSVDPNRRDGFRTAGLTLFVAVAIVFLVACLNVANILLARSVRRRRELAVRVALGAGRWRLVRQMFTESSALFLVGAGAGLGLLLLARPWLGALRPPERFYFSNPTLDLPLDLRVLGFAILATGLAATVFGMLPALRATAANPRAEMQAGGPPKGGGLPPRDVVVLLQAAFSVVALAGAGLFGRALGAAIAIDPGFDVERVGMLSVNLHYGGLGREEQLAFYRQAAEEVRAVPGVMSASFNAHRPLEFGTTGSLYLHPGAPPESRVQVRAMTVTPGYFETLGVPLLAGRDFRWSTSQSASQDDGEMPVLAVVNQRAAELLWPGEPLSQVVGRRFEVGGSPREVVGVVPTLRYVTLGEASSPAVYVSLGQRVAEWPTATLFYRTAGPPQGVLSTVLERITALDGRVVIHDLEPAIALLDRALWAPRAAAGLVAGLGSLALFLAAVGIYGVVSAVVGERKREIGIRMALGAGRARVYRDVVGRMLFVVLLGVGLGLPLAVAGGRVAAGLLYGVSPTDLVALSAACAMLVLVTLVAAWAPARRAARIDPLEVIRAE